MKGTDTQLTMFRAFSSGREGILLLVEVEGIIDAIAMDVKWQEEFIEALKNAGKKKRQKYKKVLKQEQLIFGQSNGGGRQGYGIVFIIRLILAQCVLRKDYRELAALLIDSKALRRFLEIEQVEGKNLPRFQVISDWVRAIPEQLLEAINQHLMIKEGKDNLGMNLEKWRSDATVVESNIHYPTDSALLRDGLRWMHRWIKRMREDLGILSRMDTETLTYESGHRLYLEILKFRGFGRKKAKARKKSYRKLLNRTRQMMFHFQRHVEKGKELGVLSGIGFSDLEMIVSYAKYQEMLKEWERLKPLIEKACDQAERRVLKCEEIASSDKLLSLWEDHSRIIIRGKAGRQCEFGHKITLWESEEGMIVCGGIYKEGNPGESKILEGELARLSREGYVFNHLSLDRGYYDEEKLKEITQKNGKIVIYCPKKGKKDKERAEYEKTKEFQEMQRFRVGIEGSISVLVRRHSLRRAMLKKWEGFGRHVHMCFIGMNLLRLLDYRKANEFQEQQVQKEDQKLSA